MHFDFIIVGQGIAGTCLSHSLSKRGASVGIIDSGSGNTSSRIAAGLFNPIIGKNMLLTWMADELFPFAGDYYKELENFLEVNVYHEKNIYRLFTGIAEQNQWASNSGSARYSEFLKGNRNLDQYQNVLKAPYGGFEITQAGYVDVALLLDQYRLIKPNGVKFFDQSFNYDDVEYDVGKISIGDLSCNKVLFCEGYRIKDNPYFSSLPFNPAKGEVLTVKIDSFPEDVIFNRPVFVLPIGDGLYKVGATYEWDDQSLDVTEMGRSKLVARLESMIKVPFEVVDQQAGIRPTTKPRRPFIGFHKEYPNLGVFNGMGTKGVTLAPYLANHFAEHILNGSELMKEVRVDQYFTRTEKPIN